MRLRNTRSTGDPDAWKTVVGVVADVREYDTHPMTWYVPYEQTANTPNAANLVIAARVRGEVDAARLFRAVSSVDPTLAIREVLPATLLHSEAFAGERFTTGLLSIFSLGGLLMAAIGIYGVLAYYVSRRVREIGVRLALGARPTIILRSVLFHGLTLVVLGLGAGLVGSQAATKLVGSTVPELASLNITAVIVAALVLGLVAAVATYVPAQRAMRADPIEVLRAE
jgi:hypothetical protein